MELLCVRLQLLIQVSASDSSEDSAVSAGRRVSRGRKTTISIKSRVRADTLSLTETFIA